MAVRSTILARILRGYLIVIAILAVLAPALFLTAANERFDDMAVENLSRSALIVAEALSPKISAGDIPALREGVESLGRSSGYRITIVDADGTVLADNRADPDTMESHRARPEIIAALEGTESRSERGSETLGQRMLYVAVPVPDASGGVSAVVRTAMPFDTPALPAGSIALRVLVLALSAGAASALIAWFLANAMASPIRRLAEANERFRGGDFTTRAEPVDILELDALAVSFNETVAETGRMVAQITERSSQLEAVFECAAGPLALLGPGTKISLVNSSFIAVAGGGVAGRDYREVLSVAGLSALVRRALDTREGRVRTTFSGRVWECSWRAVEGSGQVVLGMLDVSELASLENIKKDFILNLSHELRTPLTAIGGFAEALRERCDEKGREYIAIISRNVERLSGLVRDTQALAELESGDPSSRMESVDLCGILAPVTEMFRPGAAGRNLDLVLETQGPLMVYGDPYRLEQVFVNLIDNAIKYTDSGRILVDCRAVDDEAVVSVSDTGCGIPREFIPRLCERFFTVDRSRARKLGGTGLGLSIVKHVLMAHNGRLEIESSPGEGSVFRVILPSDRSTSSS